MLRKISQNSQEKTSVREETRIQNGEETGAFFDKVARCRVETVKRGSSIGAFLRIIQESFL